MKKYFTTFKKRKEILKAKKIKNKIENSHFKINYEKSEKCCVLFIITKKNFKTSVKRNLLKRRMKEILFDFSKNKYSINYHLVIFFKKSLDCLPFNQIKDSLFSLIKTIK